MAAKLLKKVQNAPWLVKAAGFTMGGLMLMGGADAWMRSGRLGRLRAEVPGLGKLGVSGEYCDECLMPLFYLSKAAIGQPGLDAYDMLCRAVGRMNDDMYKVYALDPAEAARLPLQFMTEHFQYVSECVVRLFEQSSVPMRAPTEEEEPHSFGLTVPDDVEWRNHMYDLLEHLYNEILNCEQDIRSIVVTMADSAAHVAVAAGQDAEELKAISMRELGLKADEWPPQLPTA